MQGLLFTNTLMLAGLAALAIPILIHLLLKRRKKKLAFSTIRFFQQQDEQSSRRRKLRNWLLLALRLLIVTLLVLAFARPFARQSQASAETRKQRRVVFVLDSSASMLATGTEGQRWAQAKAQIQKVLSGMQSDDLCALIECGTHANVLSGFAAPASVTQMLRDLSPGLGSSTLSEGVQQAVRLLSGSPMDSGPLICVVSDLQKSACRGLSTCPVPQGIEFKVLPVGDLSAPNLAVVKVDAQTHEGTRPQATIASFSDEDTSSAGVEFATENGTFVTQSIALKTGASTNVEIALPALKPGWHDLKVNLRTRDSLEADNIRFATFFIREPARVLVAEPRSSARSFEQASFFLSSALDPTKDSTNSMPGTFKLTSVSPERLTEALGGAKDRAWNVVMMPGLKDLPSGIGKALMTFVKEGGGLVLFLDEEMSANRYNSELADLLPARLGTPEQSPDANSPWRITLYDTNSVVFSAFRSPNSGDLRIPEFPRRYSLELTEGSMRLSYFEDGVPLVTTRTVGKGRVVLVNTSADTAWTDWPKHKTFVPFLHGLTSFAAQNADHENPIDAPAYIAGDDLEIEAGLQSRGGQFMLRRPDGKELKLTADDRGRVRDSAIAAPGIYSLRDNQGKEVRRIAVNIPDQESNLEALRPNDFLQQLVRTQENPKQTLASGLFGSRNDQREFWTALLLGALVLLLVEPFVANRTSV